MGEQLEKKQHSVHEKVELPEDELNALFQRETKRKIGSHTAADYRNAPDGSGELGAEWKDKPHRLIYALLRDGDDLNTHLLVALEEVNKVRAATVSKATHELLLRETKVLESRAESAEARVGEVQKESDAAHKRNNDLAQILADVSGERNDFKWQLDAIKKSSTQERITTLESIVRELAFMVKKGCSQNRLLFALSNPLVAEILKGGK